MLKVDRMVEKMALNPETPRRRRGRPSKQEEVRRALAEIGCDPMAINPRRILAGIAADETIAPTARVAAAKTLLLEQRDQGLAATKQPGKAEARPGKRVAAQRAAAAAGGMDTPWGEDLWPDGRRPQ
jgi:hypothetical protein